MLLLGERQLKQKERLSCKIDKEFVELEDEYNTLSLEETEDERK